ncbi:MAG: glycosyltransferase family 4 protein [Candidatus Zixiibacteriota bacterium]
MRLLLVTQFFPPETGATQNRLGALVRTCREEGIDVIVVTAMPHYPAGRILPEYQGRIMKTELDEGVQVIRAWLFTHGRGKWWRMMSFLSFAVTALLVGMIRAPRVDVVIWETPPLFLGPTAWLLAKIKGARLVTNVSDLWPASILALGGLRDGTIMRCLKTMEQFLYRRSALISGQTQAIVADIAGRVPAVPVIHWGNGAEPVPEKKPDSESWRRRWGIASHRFLAGYAGLFGLSQGLEIIPQVAALTPDVVYVLVGDGPARTVILSEIARRRLHNVICVPTQPHENMPAVWSAFDCTLVCLKNLPLFRGAVPSKLFEAMASGTPVILAVDGEAAEIVESSGCGLVTPPGDVSAIAQAIARLVRNTEERQQMGRRGRLAIAEHYDRRALNRRFIGAIKPLVDQQRL